MSLGKRKERDDESLEATTASASHGPTLFVSNLPYTATSVDLQTLFSDIAPVRSAFVVTEHGTGVSKGVGYVSFAMKEDAESAYGKISKEGIILAGRKLRVDWAEHKSKNKQRDLSTKKEPKARPIPRPTVQTALRDPNAIRTIVVSGLPPAIDAKQLWKKFRKYDGAEKVEWPQKLGEGFEDSGIAQVLFTTPAAASNAVSKLHAHVFKGSLLSVTLKKRFETLAKPGMRSKEGGGNPATAAPSHASRLIVRNLPFDITEQDLRAVFLPYGPIYSIHIPTVDVPSTGPKVEGENSTSKSRAKGFAFVWMLSKKDAESAIEGCNGKSVRARTAVDLISDKQKRKKQKRLEEKLRKTGEVEDKERGAQDEGDGNGDEAEAEGKARERVIVVDWALSKDKWEQEKVKIEQQQGDTTETANGSSGEDTEDEESEDDAQDGEEHLGLGSDAEEESDISVQETDEDEENREEPVKPQLPPPEVGTTLFIRNVPFSATEDELRTLFRVFGPLRYARITTDHATGRSRGTGFACFWNKDDADKVIEQSDLLRKETTGSVSVPSKKNPFVLPSILTPDPSSSLAQSLVLHGRTLDVVRAVTRDEAGKLKEEGEKARQKADKRNTYLLKEGVILPNSPLAQDLSPADLERRTNSFNARRALLKSNPSLLISRTRLSVRQIPVFVTERVLKRLALHAVRAFESEVKEGDRNGLIPEELVDPPSIREEEDEGEAPPSRRKSLKGRASGVKQAKIVRQQERVDPVTGKGRSKGYGFIEMHKHADALRVLRWANYNLGVGLLFEEWYKEELKDLLKLEKGKDVKDRDDTKIKRMKDEIENGPTKKGKASLIVEFSIENIQVVQRRNTRQAEAPKVQAADTSQPKKRKSRSESPGNREKTDESSSKKKRTDSTGSTRPEAGEKAAVPKLGQSIGSIIGRKRKERKRSGERG